MAIAFVVGTKKAVAGTTAAIDTNTSPVVNLIVIQTTGHTAAPTPTDSEDNTYTPVGAGEAQDGDARTRMFYCAAPNVSDTHTFTMAGSFSSMVVACFSGAAVATPIDQSNSANNQATTGTPGSITPSEDNEVVLSGLGGSAAGTPACAGYTLVDAAEYDAGVSYATGLAYLVQTSAGATNPAWTWPSGGTAGLKIHSFKEFDEFALVAAQTGDRSDTDTWVGGVVPVNGYTFTVPTGITVTWDTSTPVGHSPAEGDGTPAIKLEGTGKIVIDDGISLVCRGDYLSDSSEGIVLGNNSVFEFDASQAASPSTQNYRAYIVDGNEDAYTFKTTATGWEIRSNAGGGNGYIDNDSNDRYGLIDLQGSGEVNDLGTAGIRAMQLSCFADFGAITGSTIRIAATAGSHIDFDGCGRVGIADIGDTMNCILSGLRFTNCIDAIGDLGPTHINVAGTARTTGTRTFYNISGDDSGNFVMTAPDFVGSYIVGYLYDGATPDLWDSLDYVAQINIDETSVGNATKVAFLFDVGGATGVHFFISRADTTWTDVYIEVEDSDNTNDFGEGVLGGENSIINGMILVPCSVGTNAGNSPGAAANFLAGEGTGFQLKHSVINCAGVYGVYFGEGGAASADSVPENGISSNIFWGTGGVALANTEASGPATEDECPADAFNYNLLATDLADGALGNGIQDMDISTGTYNANGANAEITFRNASANAGTWSTTQGGAGTMASAMALLLSNPLLLESFWTYQQNAWLCTSPEADGTGLAGTDMGIGFGTSGEGSYIYEPGLGGGLSSLYWD